MFLFSSSLNFAYSFRIHYSVNAQEDIFGLVEWLEWVQTYYAHKCAQTYILQTTSITTRPNQAKQGNARHGTANTILIALLMVHWRWSYSHKFYHIRLPIFLRFTYIRDIIWNNNEWVCARECFVYMHRLKWCMCTVLWLQFTPSYYHHEPSTFNYIRYCLKWIFPSIRLFPSTSLTHTLILILFTLPIIMLQKKKEKNTSRCNVCIVVNATNHHCNECICDDFIWYIGCSCYILLWIRIFFCCMLFFSVDDR